MAALPYCLGLCGLCFGWPWVCLPALALAFGGHFYHAQVKAKAAFRAALSDFRFCAFAPKGCSLGWPWVAFALALRPLLWLCLLCFGWVGLCLGALALALCGALPSAQMIPLAALRAALFDWRVPALALPALPWVGFALALPALPLALPALPWVGLCFALGGVLAAWGAWCWVLGVFGAWGVGCLGWPWVWLWVCLLAGLVSARSGFGRSPLGCSGCVRRRRSGSRLHSVGLRSVAPRVFGLRSASGLWALPPFLRPPGRPAFGFALPRPRFSRAMQSKAKRRPPLRPQKLR